MLDRVTVSLRNVLTICMITLMVMMLKCWAMIMQLMAQIALLMDK